MCVSFGSKPMHIQPITSYRMNASCLNRTKSKNTPINQPNFKGIKGFVKGGAAGGGIVAFCVAFFAGIGAVPTFMPYIILNGILGACTGHTLEKKFKEESSTEKE